MLIKIRWQQSFRKRVQSASFLYHLRFRGYYCRKYVQDFYARKRWLDSISRNAQTVMISLQNHYESQLIAKEQEDRQVAEAQMDEISNKLGYLLSTETCPGVFVSPFGSEFDMSIGNVPIEYRIRAKVRKNSAEKIKHHDVQVFSSTPLAIKKHPMIPKHPKQTVVS